MSHYPRSRLSFILCAALLVTSVGACAKRPPATTLSADPSQQLVVIYVVDGLRRSLAYKTGGVLAPYINNGVALEAESVYPHQTVVNFMSLATGSSAKRHSLLAGYSVGGSGPARPERFGPQHIEVPTLFKVMKEAGLRTAMIGFKGYDLLGFQAADLLVDGRALQKKDPGILYGNKYRDTWKVTAAEAARFKDGFAYGWLHDSRRERSADRMVYANKIRMTQIVVRRALAQLATAVKRGEAPNLIVFNLGSCDLIAHTFGPHHEYYPLCVQELVRGIDIIDGELRRIYHASQLNWPRTTIITSDHGFSMPKAGRKIIPWDFRSNSSTLLDQLFVGLPFRADNGGGAVLFLTLPSTGDAYKRDYEKMRKILRSEQRKKESWIAQVYAKYDRPLRYDIDLATLPLSADYQRLNIDHRGKAADFYVDLASGWTLGPNYGHGSHDEDNSAIPLIITGPAVRRAGTVSRTSHQRPASIVDIAPTVLALFGVNAPTQWDGRVLKEYIASDTKR